MKGYAKSFGIFLAMLVITNVVVAPAVRKFTPKDSAGQPVIKLL